MFRRGPFCVLLFKWKMQLHTSRTHIIPATVEKIKRNTHAHSPVKRMKISKKEIPHVYIRIESTLNKAIEIEKLKWVAKKRHGGKSIFEGIPNDDDDNYDEVVRFTLTHSSSSPVVVWISGVLICFTTLRLRFCFGHQRQRRNIFYCFFRFSFT